MDRRRLLLTASDGAESQFSDDGWLATGDVGAPRRADGYMRLVGPHRRTSSSPAASGSAPVELENADHGATPTVAEAAVIACRTADGAAAGLRGARSRGARPPTKNALAHLTPPVARWWLPDDVVFVEELPKTSVGKLSKRMLREEGSRTHQPPE